jgi:hypothetical protein
VPTGGSPQDMESQLGNLGIPPGWFSGFGGMQPTAGSSWEGLSELPTHGYKLRHQTQGRPRPPRTTPPGPGRPSVSPKSLARGPAFLSNARTRGSSFRTQTSETLASGDRQKPRKAIKQLRNYSVWMRAGLCCR